MVMKKNYVPLSFFIKNFTYWLTTIIVLMGISGSITAQIISDNFDSYVTGPLSGQSTQWTTWAGTGNDDGIIVDTIFNSGPNSLLIGDYASYSSDVILLLGNRTSGTYSINFNLIIPSEKVGYYNLQEDEVPGVGWNLDVYFNREGGEPGVGSFDQSDSTFIYPEDEWFAIHMVIDLDANLMSFWINEQLVYADLAFDGYLGSLNFWSISESNELYIDNVVFDEAEPLSPCPFPTIICDNFDVYTPGEYLASQSDGLWTTWSGMPGTGEDAFVTDEFAASAPNAVLLENTTTDLVLPLGDLTTGTYRLQMSLYFPAGFGGYFNMMHSFSTNGGPYEWAIDVFFNGDGTGSTTAAGETDVAFDYSEDTWIDVFCVVDLDNDLAWMFVEGINVRTWQWSLINNTGAPGLKTLAVADFFPDAVDNPKFYLDNVSFFKTSPIGCGSEAIICDNYDFYSAGFLSPQSEHWTTWSGIEGGDEDGIVTTDQAQSAPNCMFIDSTGTQNVLLMLGSVGGFDYAIEFDVYVPQNASGVFRFINTETPNDQSALSVFFNKDGILPGTGVVIVESSEVSNEFNYPENEWFKIRIGFGYECDLIIVDINGNTVSFIIDNIATIDALNFFSLANNDGTNTNQLYIDNLRLEDDFYICSSVKEFTNHTGIQLFPNPGTGMFKINSENLSGVFEYDIIDFTGKVVYTNRIRLTIGNNSIINASILKTGVYIIRMVDQASGNLYSTRFSVQK